MMIVQFAKLWTGAGNRAFNDQVVNSKSSLGTADGTHRRQINGKEPDLLNMFFTFCFFEDTDAWNGGRYICGFFSPKWQNSIELNSIIFAEVEVSRISTTGAGLEIWTVSDQSLVFCIFQVSLEPGNWPCPKDDIRFHMSLGIFVALVWLHVSKAVAEVKSASPSGIPRAPAEATGPVMGGHHFWTHHHTRSQTS